MSSSEVLGIAAAITVVFALLVWVPFVVLTLQCRESRAVRIFEKITRHWILGAQWMTAIILVYIVLSMRAGDPTAIVQVCYEFPWPPIGPSSVVVMGAGVMILQGISKSLLAQPDLNAKKTPLPQLPGGLGTWIGLGVLIFFSVFLYLTISGPGHHPRFEGLSDVNTYLQDAIPKINEGLAAKVPESFGDCDALVEHRKKVGESMNGKKCVGHKPIADIVKIGEHLTARWVTGLNSIEITSFLVLPPRNPPRLLKPTVTAEQQRWNFVINGNFKKLLVWLTIELDLVGKMLDTVWLDENMCCDEQINFTIQASAECTPDHGFHRLHMDIPKLDLIEFHHMHEGFHPMEALDEAKLQAVRFLDAPFKEAFVSELRHIVKDKTENMRIQSNGDVINPMVYISEMVEKVLVLNTGARCPEGALATPAPTPIFAQWQRPQR